jgi:hypothetical protein
MANNFTSKSFVGAKSQNVLIIVIASKQAKEENVKNLLPCLF